MSTSQPTPDPAPRPDGTPSIPWEDRPPGSTDVLWRSSRNPIIGRHHLPRSNSIFNSAVVPFRDGYAGVFRVDDTTREMNLHVGRSADGVNWTIVEETIAFEPADGRIPEITGPVRARLRPARDLARGSLLRHVVQRLPRTHDRRGVHARLRDVPPAGERVPAVQPQRRPVPAPDRRQVRDAQPPQRQRAHPVRGHLLLGEPGPGPLGPASPRHGAHPVDRGSPPRSARGRSPIETPEGWLLDLPRRPDVVQRVRLLDGAPRCSISTSPGR